MKYSLRPYQKQADARTVELIESGCQRILGVAPTGAGKTVWFCHRAEQVASQGGRVLIVAHRKELIDQPSRKLDDIGLYHGIIQGDHPRQDPRARIQIASVQTLEKRLNRYDMGFDLIVIDEAHHSPAASYMKVIDQVFRENPRAILLGLTATPYRIDGRGLGECYNQMVEVATTSQLIDQGYLVAPVMYVGKRIDLRDVRSCGPDFNQAQLAKKMQDPKLVGDSVQEYLKHCPDRLAIAFSVGLENSRMLAEAFMDAGVPAWHIDSKIAANPRERERIFKEFESAERGVLCNMGIATEGYDCPRVSCIINRRPTESRSLWRQMIGRGLRPFDGKENCIILDHANSRDMHGYITDPDRLTLAGGLDGGNERTPATRECPTCRAQFAGYPSRCPHCGIELTRNDERIDIPLNTNDGYVLVKDEGQREPKRIDFNQQNIIFWTQLKRLYEKGENPMIALHAYKRNTGQWPARDVIERSKYKFEKVKHNGNSYFRWCAGNPKKPHEPSGVEQQSFLN